jgi:hypothetical protein
MHPVSSPTPSSLALTTALARKPMLRAESPGEQQHRDSLIVWILRSAEINEQHQYMLNTLATDALHAIMTTFYDSGTREGMHLLESYWQRFIHDSRNTHSLSSEHINNEPFSALENRPYERTPIYTDGEPLRESRRVLASSRTCTLDSTYTMIFNYNNSPVPRHALAARPSPLTDSIQLINSHINDVQGMYLNYSIA